MSILMDKVGQNLKKYFGYDNLRDAQKPVLEAILDGKDVLAIMPTGGGKSLCYQLPAVLEGVGLTLVVSPLVALMEDQVTSLKKNGVRADFLNSSQTREEQELIKIEDLQLLYVSPEKLLGSESSFLEYLSSNFNIRLVAIDEAHCISSWGHDFRPEYSQLNILKKFFPKVPIIALTATADELTQKDIVDRLELNNPKVFISSFDRPNINYRIDPKQNSFSQLTGFIKEHPDQAGIVYCLSRKSTESVAEKLNSLGIKAKPYHAGLSSAIKTKTYKDFTNDKIQVVVATIAFGMGIDKPNVRFVVHWNLPKSIENYYQETGRAGRDGLPAQAYLLYSSADLVMLRDFIDKDGSEEGIKRLQKSKLDRLVEFCNTGHCRRRVLLQYFKEDLGDDCHNCDRCEKPVNKVDATELAQKLISTIYKTGQKFGTMYIVELLLGQGSDKVIRNGHNQISTFGIGKNIEKEAWLAYVNQLVDTGFLDYKYDNFMKTLVLNQRSFETARGNNQVLLVEYVKPEKVKKETISGTFSKAKALFDLNPIEIEIFNKLKVLRRSIADKDNVPAFVIFSDASLVSMTKIKPKNLLEFLTVSGVGNAKRDKYGKVFLGVLNS
jgi:ATP-dependent DNA helicase RecQ